MRIIIFSCGIACIGLGFAEFDLKQYERSLKAVIPWSLKGSAQDLRSDAKHALQMILRSIVLLRPEVPWFEEQKPDEKFIVNAFNTLKEYLALPGNGVKKQWVSDSLNFITDTYIPQVNHLLENPGELMPELKGLLSRKRELIKTFIQTIDKNRSILFEGEDPLNDKRSKNS